MSILVFALCATSSFVKAPSETTWTYVGEQVKPPFEVKGTLQLVYLIRKGGVVVKTEGICFSDRQGKVRLLDGPRSLHGLVNIKSESEALAFVRMFSGPALFNVWSLTELACEVQSNELFTSEQLYCLSIPRLEDVKRGTGFNGIIGRSDPNATEVPTVKTTISGFEITRLLYTGTGDMIGKIVKRTESVTSAGAYRFVCDSLISPAPHDWRFRNVEYERGIRAVEHSSLNYHL